MKTRLTIPMIAFALALAGISVRAHTSFTTANSAPAATNATNHQAAPAIRALPPARRPSLDASSLSHSGALTLEGRRKRAKRSPKPSELAATLPINPLGSVDSE
jgi:hypothetical protein